MVQTVGPTTAMLTQIPSNRAPVTAPTANTMTLIPTVSPMVQTVGPTTAMLTQVPSNRAPVTAVPTLVTVVPAVPAPSLPPANFSTLAPTAFNTSGSLSPVVPSVNQSEAIKTNCTLGIQGNYGSDLGFANRLKYVYEVTVTLQTDANVLKNVILPEIEKQITILLLPLYFPSSCGSSSTRIGDERRIQEFDQLSGLSGSPWDKSVDGLKCDLETAEGNVCYVVDGVATLFTNDRQNMTDTLALGKETIAKAMEAGAFTATSGFVGVRPRESSILTTNTTGEGGTSETKARKLPVWAYIFVIGAILFCIVIGYCVYAIPQRGDSSPWDETVDVDPNNPTSYDSPHVANMDDSWVPANDPLVHQGIGMEESFTETSYRSGPVNGDNNSYAASRASGSRASGSRASGSRASESRYSSDHSRDTRETRGSVKSRKSRVDDDFDRVYLQNGGNEEELIEGLRSPSGHANHGQQYRADMGSRRPLNDFDDDHDEPFLAPMLPSGLGPRKKQSIDMAPMNTANQDEFDAFGFGQSMGTESLEEDDFGVFD